MDNSTEDERRALAKDKKAQLEEMKNVRQLQYTPSY
jgi:hypothetical protein